MNINNIANKTLDFTVKRIAELTGILLVVLSILLFISLVSYYPKDPNFIFSGPTEKIRNTLGFRGSFISDLFFQSIGLVSILVSITIFFTGINLFRIKKFLLIIENLFCTVLYSILGSLFFYTFYSNSFWLSINGNGGFIGKFLLRLSLYLTK